jgi:hypothetical protein
MTTCTICGSPCAGSDETSNPFCTDCQMLNFHGQTVPDLALGGAGWDLPLPPPR